MKTGPLILVVVFIAAMVLVGLLRLAGAEGTALAPYSAYATPLYVAVTLAIIFAFLRAGVSFDHVGFSLGFRASHLVLALTAVAVLQLSSVFVAPVLEDMFGAGRDLSRFSGVEGSLRTLLLMLALSWTFAAFGEEIAFRIVMLRGIAVALGEGRSAWIIAVVVQAAVFGFVHLYQGPAGAAGALISGLVFGIITVMARGAIWPAAIAHGSNNSIGLIELYLG